MAYETAEEIKAALERYNRRIKKVVPQVVNGDCQPIPEFVDRIPDREWTVTRANGIEGCSNPTTATMTVPFGKLKMARNVRVEELMHARHSTNPKTDAQAAKSYAKARKSFIQGAEDFRIKQMAIQGEFYQDKKWRQGEVQVARMALRSVLLNGPDQAKMLMGGCPYPFEYMAYAALSTRIARGARSAWTTAIQTTYGKLHGLDEPTQDMLRAFCGDIDSAFIYATRGAKWRKRNERTPGKFNPFTMDLATKIEAVVQKYEAKSKYHSSVATPVEKSKEKKVSEDEIINHPLGPETPEEERFRRASARLEVHLPPLHRRLLFSLKTKSCSAIGPILHRVGNIVVDAVAPPIFGVRARYSKKPPVVLLDASGSMGINANNVEELIKMVPGAIVYFYSGESYKGHLVKVSERGRFCERKLFNEFVECGGNDVDYMSLKYCMVHHAGHELHWVTDEGYTWPKFHTYSLNAQLTKYAKDRGVKFHYNIEYFRKAIKQGLFNPRGY